MQSERFNNLRDELRKQKLFMRLLDRSGIQRFDSLLSKKREVATILLIFFPNFYETF